MLLTDVFLLENMQVLEESKSKGTMKIRGTFQRAEEANNNKRIYPKTVLSTQLEKLQPFIENRRLCGELDHPANDTVKLSNASHLITSLRMEGNEVMGEAELLNTPAGLTAQALVKGGVQIGISSRGMGTLAENDTGDETKTVNDDFNLITFDIVADPSTRGAFPGLMESVQKEMCEGSQCVKKNVERTLREKVFLTLLRNKLDEKHKLPKKVHVRPNVAGLEAARERLKQILGLGDDGDEEPRKPRKPKKTKFISFPKQNASHNPVYSKMAKIISDSTLHPTDIGGFDKERQRAVTPATPEEMKREQERRKKAGLNPDGTKKKKGKKKPTKPTSAERDRAERYEDEGGAIDVDKYKEMQDNYNPVYSKMATMIAERKEGGRLDELLPILGTLGKAAVGLGRGIAGRVGRSSFVQGIKKSPHFKKGRKIARDIASNPAKTAAVSTATPRTNGHSKEDAERRSRQAGTPTF